MSAPNRTSARRQRHTARHDNTGSGSAAWILVAAVLVLSACAGPAPPPAPGNGRNLLLVTLETTRADHLGFLGAARNTSPYLDALAREGVVFEQATSVSPRTNPSLASLLTSRHVQDHGVRDLLRVLPEERRTLAEVLRGMGYATAAVQTHPRLRAESGFHQGFDAYLDDVDSHFLAQDACREAEAWIRRKAPGGRPWFLWLHLMDPHWRYAPPAGWRGMFGEEDPRPWGVYQELAAGERRMGDIVFRNDMPPDLVEAFVRLYDAEIRYADAVLGRMLGELRDDGLLHGTLVVVTADHGESLGEHDYYFEHGAFGTQPEIHVPLLLAGTEELGAGLRLPWSVSLVDVAPTILKLLDLDPEPEFRGRDLMPMIRGEEKDHRVVFGETGRRFHPENLRRRVDGPEGHWRWARRGRWKMVHEPTGPDTWTRRLYDLAADPGETDPIPPDTTLAGRELSELLSAWMEGREAAIEAPVDRSPETLEQLRSLGYVD